MHPKLSTCDHNISLAAALDVISLMVVSVKGCALDVFPLASMCGVVVDSPCTDVETYTVAQSVQIEDNSSIDYGMSTRKPSYCEERS